LIKKCCARNNIKNSPESAIATFLAIDDFNNPDFAIIFIEYNLKSTQK
jgi:hypothetical protein